MNPTLFLFLSSLGALSGFGASFIGVGGGILLFPSLLYFPPYLGLPPLDAKTAAALVISEVFFAGAVGGAAHWRRGRVHKRLTVIGAVCSAVGAFIGGVASKWASEGLLLFVFGAITIVAGVVMFLPAPSRELEEAPMESITVASLPLAAISLGIGAVVGLLGAGNFLFIPLLIYLLKIPTRITIGSSLAIYVLNSLSGFVGKLITGQIPFLMALAVVIGASLGALVGEKCHSKVSPRVLRYAFSAVIAVVALRIWITLLF
jgi:uncharacterized membrane protein YfcA